MSAALRPRFGAVPAGVLIFLAFALAYFFSALLRAVTATLAPVFHTELGIGAADLGLLAGAYFLGFSAMQLPLGYALDRFGPRRVLTGLLCVAALGCAGFAMADSLERLVLARCLIGIGVSACLMAPLTCFRRVFSPDEQLRANSWMLMTGSLGMLASTLPVQWLLPRFGWRGLFWALAALLAVSILVIVALVPRDQASPGPAQEKAAGYREIISHPLFMRMAPLGFFLYGGMIAMQSLWAGPWLTRVAGWSPQSAATGLFVINLGMLATFLSWGVVMPRLMARGFGAQRLMTWGVPLSLLLLASNIARGADAGAIEWAAWCIASTVVTLSQPAVGQAFPAHQAGRALSAFNLVIFAGVFSLQWGIGLVVDALVDAGIAELAAFQFAFLAFWGACALSYMWFKWVPRTARIDNAC